MATNCVDDLAVRRAPQVEILEAVVLVDDGLAVAVVLSVAADMVRADPDTAKMLRDHSVKIENN